MNTNFFRILFLFVITGLINFVFAQDIIVDKPWLRAAPSNAPALALFMTIKNQSRGKVSLVGVEAPKKLGRVELHRTQMKQGMMKMEQQASIPIEAQSMTILTPGSWHIMLIKPETVPQMGDKIKFNLLFSDNTSQLVTAEVRMSSQ